MSHPEIDYMVAQERRRDELAAAQQSRLIQIAQESQSGKPGSPEPRWAALSNQLALWAGQALYELGLRISSWGCRLQVHYANLGGRQVSSCE